MVDTVETIVAVTYMELDRRINNRLEYQRQCGVYEVRDIKYSAYYNTDKKQKYHCAMILYKRKEEKEE